MKLRDAPEGTVTRPQGGNQASSRPTWSRSAELPRELEGLGSKQRYCHVQVTTCLHTHLSHYALHHFGRKLHLLPFHR